MIKINDPIGNKIQDFKILKKIGSGGFATVYRAACLQHGYEGNHMAIKKINKIDIKEKDLKKRVESEINIHSKLKHDAIVKFWTWFEDEDYVYLVLELCEYGSLEEYINTNKALKERDACHIIKQVIEGMRYLHSKFILHRDLSLKNILITHNMQIKIADFGMAIELRHKHENAHTMLGTPNYISPEAIMKKSYNYKADCWSVGCVLYALLYGTPPFDGKDKKYMAIMNDAVMSTLKFPYYASNEAKDLLKAMLNKEPDDRIDIQDALQYPFFQKYEESSDQKSELYTPRSRDSGLCSLSSSQSGRKSHWTNESGPNSFDSNIKEMQNGYSQKMPVEKLSSCHSGSCNSLSRPDIQLEVYRHKKERPQKLPLSANSNFGSVKHLKKNIQTLPSRQEMYESHRPVSSGSREYGSARNKVIGQNGNKCHNGTYAPCYITNHEPIYAGNGLESQIEDLPIRNLSKSPLPFPSHRLKNLYNNSYYNGPNTLDSGYSNNCSQEYVPQNSCSHEHYCAPENRCSHEWVCYCRQYQAPVSKTQSIPHQHKDQNIKLVLEKNPGLDKKILKDVVNPLTTLRLLPKRYTTKNAIVSILNDGQVCLEFLKAKKNRKFVTHVCFISGDGWTILLYKPKKNLVPAEVPPPLPNNLREVNYFNFETLPETHWKKYQYAKRFIDIVRAKTPKVTIYGKEAKCVMMENEPDPDYEVNFNNGFQITQIGGKTACTDQDGCPISLTYDSDLSADTKFMLDVYTSMTERCKALEATLDKLSETNSDTGDSYFPVIVGRRPNGSLSCQDVNKENTTPQSIHSSALNGAINAMKSYDCTMNTDSSSPHVYSLQSSLPRERNVAAPIKSIIEILQNLKDLPKVKDNKVMVEYKDGVQMWSSMNGQDVCFYDIRTKQWLANIQQHSEIMRRCDDLSGILLYILSDKGKRTK